MRQPCERCGWVGHPTRAIGIFTAVRYRASFVGAPLRQTRAEAIDDQCSHQASRGASDAAFPQVSGTIGGTSEGPRIAAETPLATEADRGPR